MSKISLPLCLLLLPLLLSLAISMKLAAAGQSICREGLGPCSSDCDARCKAMHVQEDNPQGVCVAIANMPLCTCLYTCDRTPPALPAPKVCSLGLGPCSQQCGADCCNANCAIQHDNGQGLCDNSAGISLCLCNFPC